MKKKSPVASKKTQPTADIAPMQSGRGLGTATISETGPWKIYKSPEKYVPGMSIFGIANDIGIASDDLTHDAILWIYGDFSNDKQRLAYAKEISKRLNEWQAMQKAKKNA